MQLIETEMYEYSRKLENKVRTDVCGVIQVTAAQCCCTKKFKLLFEIKEIGVYPWTIKEKIIPTCIFINPVSTFFFL